MNAPDMALNTQVLQQESAQALITAKQFNIAGAQDLALVGTALQGNKALQAKISATFDPHIKRAHEAHKLLVKDKNDTLAPLVEAEAVLKRAVLTYTTEQERIRQEAERKARAQAEAEAAAIRAKAAEAEAKAKAKADELRRQEEAAREAERKAIAEGNAKAAAEAAAQAAKLASRAESTEAAGVEKAAALNVEASTIPTPVIASTVQKVSGISQRETYKAEVTSLMDLAKGVVDGSVPLMAIQANGVFLGQQARSLKTELKYPGVRVVVETGIASRAA